MAKQLNSYQVDLTFNANVGKAKSQIQELQGLLSKIAYTGSTSITGNLDKDLQNASTAAKELQIHLNNAFNATTGKFDLSMLDKSLKTSNSNISELATNLLGAGSAGQQAFVQLAQAISMADQPMLRINNKLREFATTMKNTVRWQFSSSMLHGFMGALSSAYGYAQDLNKSLTDIRIVTGASTEEMARFAEQANKAAKSLNTTTTDYTNASLIYFQQGLSDAEVEERTKVTIKMANAAGQSAKVVSDQMTAVWNNFDDGSKSLEYYADVMAALGAATASSTDEIANGLQKFASVAETVGLSYEYATAALATVTSETRESADTVGTAFKTLFARIQGLQLGEVLEDGVDLNKYSEALGKIGVEVLDANGNIREMDDILNDMGSKWQNLTEAEKQATAETVAGVRQYTHLMSLMNNWDVFQANLATAYGAEGALQEQADIYAQSWEAAEEKVKASAEGIYQSLLNDKFFISLNNGFANVLSGLDAFIDGLGGVKPLILGIGSIIASTFASSIPKALDNFKYNIKLVTKGAQDAYADIQSQMKAASEMAFKGIIAKGAIEKESSMGFAIDSANDLTAARSKLALVSDRMSDSEKQLFNTQLSIIEQTQQEIIAIKQKNEALKESLEIAKNAIADPDSEVYDDRSADNKRAADAKSVLGEDTALIFQGDKPEGLQGLEQLEIMSRSISDKIRENIAKAFDIDNQTINTADISNAFVELQDTLNKLDWSSMEDESIEQVKEQIISLIELVPKSVREVTGLDDAIKRIKGAASLKDLQKEVEACGYKMSKATIPAEKMAKAVKDIDSKGKIRKTIKDIETYGKSVDSANDKQIIFNKLVSEFSPQHTVRMSEAMGALAGVMGNVVTVANSIKSAFEALSNPDLNGWEKMSAVMSSVALVVPNVMSSLKGLGTLTSFANDQALKYIASKKSEATAILAAAAAEKVDATMTAISGAVDQQHLKGLNKKNKAKWEEILVTKAGMTQEAASAFIESLSATNKNMSAAAVLNKIKAMLVENTTETAGNVTRTTHIGLQTIINALTGKFAGLWILIAGLGIALIIAGIVAALDALNVTQKEANEAINQSTEDYQKETDKLKELKDELQSVQDAIDELHSKDSLSIVEQSELADLERRKALLEAQVALQEQLAKEAQKTQAKTIAENWDKANQLGSQPTAISKTTTYYDRTVGNYGARVSRTETLDEYAQRNGYNLETGEFNATSQLTPQEKSEISEYIKNWQQEEEAAMAQWRQDNSEQYSQNEANYSAMIAADQSGAYKLSDEEKIKMQTDLASQRVAMFGEDYDDTFIKPVLSSLENLDISQNEDGTYTAATQVSQEVLDARGINQDQLNTYLTERINANPEAMEQLQAIQGFDFNKLSGDQLFTLLDNLDSLKYLGENATLDDLKQYIDGVTAAETTQPSSNIKDWQAGYSEIQKITNDIKIGDIISAEDYKTLGEEYQKYFTLQADGTAMLTTKAEDLKNAVNEAATAELIDRIQNYAPSPPNSASISMTPEEAREVAASAASGGEDEATAQAKKDMAAYVEEVNAIYGTKFTTDNAADWEAAINYAEQRIVQAEQENAELEKNQELLAASADTLDKLNSYYERGLITAEQRDAVTESTLIKEAQVEGLDIESVYAQAEAYEELVSAQKVAGESQEEIEIMSKRIAITNQKTQKGIDSLADGWDDWSKALKTGNTLSKDYISAMAGIEDAMSDMLGLDMNQLSDGFAESATEAGLLERIVQGDLTALDELRSMAAQDIIATADLDYSGVEGGKEAIDTMLADLTANPPEIGASLDSTAFGSTLMDLLNQTDMTVAEMQALFDALGYEPVIDYMEIPAESASASQMAQAVAVFDPISQTWKEGTVQSGSQLSEGTMIRVPIINGSKTKYTSSGGGGGYTPPKASGGGGGGGSKPELKNDRDKERYHTLQNQLEDLRSEYDDISEAVDRAFGKDKLKLIDEQIAKTDELIDKQEEYVAAIAADLPKDKAIMEAYYDDLIGGPIIEFDENGNIANYDAIQDAMYAAYNENAENMSEEDWQVFEQKYEQLEKYIEQYEETYDMLRDEEQGLQDLVNQRLDQELAKIQYTIELKLNVADDALEVLEYQLSQLEDDAFAAAEAIALLGDKASLLQDKMAAARQGIDSILGQSLSSSEIELFMSGDTSVLEGKTFTEEQMNQLRDYRSELLSLNEELLQIREDVQSKVMDTFDAWNEKLQKGIEKFDHYSSVLTSYKNIVDLVGKSYLGVDNELLKSMNDAMIENSINKAGATRAAYEALLESQANAQAQYEAAIASGNENDIKFWSDTLEAIGEEVDAAQENMMAAWEESLQLAAEEFQRQVDIALEEFNIALTGFASMEEFRENFDFAKEVEEEYVPAYEKIYELSKLNRDINKTLNDDRVIKGKEKLLELQKKINQYQQDGVEMSEYEIANLQREYDLRMAEIALEEARNAKDTVRMSKDNEGNWSYVYTTNTEAVDTAQQDYEDALFAMQQANDEYLDEMSNLILDATQRMNEEIAALRLEDFANQQEYDAAVQAITDKYMGRIKYGQEQMQLAINNNADLYQNDWTAYSEATGYKIATDEEYVDSFNETVLGKLLNSESQVVNVYDMINDQIGGLLEATSGAYADWSGQVDAANQAAGTSTDNFAEDMNNAINGPGGISESSGDAADSVYDMAEDMIEDFDRVAQAVSDWQRSYSNDIDTIIEKNLDAIEVCNALLAVLSDVQDVDLSNLTPTYDPYGKTYDNTTNSKDKDEEVVVVPVEQRDGNNNNSSRSGGGIGRRAGIDSLSWNSVPHFASGGYTGEWGDDGRLAVLHQKELVLNAEDTTNMFKALNLTRQILDTIDLNAQYASGGLGQVMASSIRDAITQTLEQHVTIEADFPSVTDHNEIEIAMKNLINTASQFAHRK